MLFFDIGINDVTIQGVMMWGCDDTVVMPEIKNLVSLSNSLNYFNGGHGTLNGLESPLMKIKLN